MKKKVHELPFKPGALLKPCPRIGIFTLFNYENIRSYKWCVKIIEHEADIPMPETILFLGEHLPNEDDSFARYSVLVHGKKWWISIGELLSDFDEIT